MRFQKINLLIWLLLLTSLFLPIVLRDRFHAPPEVWNLLHISTLILIYLIPKWIILGIMLGVTGSIIYVGEVYSHQHIPPGILTVSNIVSNGFLLIFVTFFRIKSHVSMRKLEEQSNKDVLTGLYNRRYFQEFIHMFFKDEHPNEQHSIILCDVDNFKSINDNYGHHAGDEVIRSVASLLMRYSQSDSLIVRMGGEEFLIFIPNKSKEEAFVVAEEIRYNISNQWMSIQEQRMEVTLSFGVASCHYFHEIETTINKADKAMYLAKKLGKNRTCLSEG